MIFFSLIGSQRLQEALTGQNTDPHPQKVEGGRDGYHETRISQLQKEVQACSMRER